MKSETDVGKPTDVDKWLAMSFISKCTAIVLAYDKRFGEKKIESDEGADAKYILEWYEKLPKEEKIAIHNEAIEMFKDFYSEGGK